LFPHFHLLIWGLKQRESPTVSGRFSEAYVDVGNLQLELELLDLWAEVSCGRRRSEAEAVSEDAYGGRSYVGSRAFVGRAVTLECLCRGAELGIRWANEVVCKMSFQDWSSLAWYHVVGSHNLDHLQAGVRVECVRSWGGVASYASKYLAKEDAQFMEDIEWGRSWGIFNRKCIPWAKIIELELDVDVGVRLRRVARRYLERRRGRRFRAPYGLTLYCDTAHWAKLWARPPPDPF
jgi:hypothetical protein